MGSQIKNVKDFKVSQSDFIVENKGKFREFYSIGSSLGAGKKITLSIFH